MTDKLRVWHIPQIPGKPFYVEVSSVQEGAKVMQILADYDEFQLDNNIKGDFCNTNGLELFDESIPEDELSDMGLEDRWVTWFYEDDAGNYFEEPDEYLEWLATQS